jgi:hypothetical protein
VPLMLTAVIVIFLCIPLVSSSMFVDPQEVVPHVSGFRIQDLPYFQKSKKFKKKLFSVLLLKTKIRIGMFFLKIRKIQKLLLCTVLL